MIQKKTIYTSVLKSSALSMAVLGLLCGCCVNCGNGGHAVEPATRSDAQKNNPASQTGNGMQNPSVAPESGAPETAKGELRFDFAANLSLAHLNSSGLLIDFGTPSRFKYTVGDWKSGWRGNFNTQGNTISYIEGKATRVFFMQDALDATNGANLVIRARGIGKPAKGRLYLNGESLGPVEFPADFGHVTKELTGLLKPGNNELLLRFESAAKAEDGKFARLAVDYMRVIPKDADDSQAASAVTSVLTRSNGGESAALMLRAGETLTYYVPVPQEAFLWARLRSIGESKTGDVTITVSGHTMAQKDLLKLSTDARGDTAAAPLGECADDICKVSVHVSAGEVLFESLQMRVQAQSRKKASGKRAATNVVLVLIDTLRADHLAAYNPQTRVQTPFLDALAKESMVFEKAWAQENWTKPSITSLLSGLYSAAHQNKTESNKVPSSVTMIQEHLSKLGFETAGFVANGYISDKFGFKRGWDSWTNYVREGKKNRAEFVADEAVQWLKKRKEEKPFFLYVHTIDPHVPYIPPAKYRALYDNEPYTGIVQADDTANLLEKVKTGAVRLTERDKIRLEALYDGEISYHDEHIRKVYEELQAEGLLENTVIVVTADHGEEFFEHGSVGHGHTLYEELLHVPLMIRLPGAVAADDAPRFTDEVELVDVLPTVCDLTGVATPKEVQGKSLLPQLDGIEPNWPNAAFSEFMDGQLAVRTSRYKLIYRGLRTSLFDLQNDPRETADLSDERPEAFVLMRDLLGMHMGRFAASEEVSLQKSGVKEGAKKTNAGGPAVHQREDAVIDAQTRKQLEALGYMGD